MFFLPFLTMSFQHSQSECFVLQFFICSSSIYCLCSSSCQHPRDSNFPCMQLHGLQHSQLLWLPFMQCLASVMGMAYIHEFYFQFTLTTPPPLTPISFITAVIIFASVLSCYNSSLKLCWPLFFVRVTCQCSAIMHNLGVFPCQCPAGIHTLLSFLPLSFIITAAVFTLHFRINCLRN
jgi:hypothetical protein